MIAAHSETDRDLVAALERAFAPVGDTIARFGTAPTLLAKQRTSTGVWQSHRCAFAGWIDNAAELETSLNMPHAGTATLYAAAVARWGEGADRRINGSYCAIVALPDSSLRLSRSPWDAPPLYYGRSGKGWVASPLLRVLFAAGVERSLDWDMVADELACAWPGGGIEPPFRDIGAVPLGTITMLASGGQREHRWYRLPQPMEERHYDETEAVRTTLGLLDEAVAAAKRWSIKPSLALSGGLDSPLVAASWARMADAEESHDCLTFVPDTAWRGYTPMGTFGDESGRVRELGAMYPALQCHIATGDVGSFDREARSLLASMQVYAPGLANVAMMHELYGKARELGSAELWTADLGNTTFSNQGLSAYCEYAKPGRFGQLFALLRNRADDHRPLWRRFVALSILPQLPARLRKRLRATVHSEEAGFVAHQTLLRPEALKGSERARIRHAQSAWADVTHERTRAEGIAEEWEACEGRAHDVHLAFEERYGVARRDVTAYRPLIEYCLSLPTKAFAWDGIDRRLARNMGEGRLPRSIHANRLYARHNVDWHERIARDRMALIETFERAAEHPQLSSILDCERILDLLADWPDRPPDGYHVDWPLRNGIPRALIAARFAGMIEDRNDL